ncbi:hypothetical protein SSX86_003754 [Deinandra increscens subsp. villosa]|uniref:Uncharacterized protein n=1 Tax=Deinandra increscens subsp. villosa TaxID=3103831 RepID=A0AAP0DHV9_9ASTR
MDHDYGNHCGGYQFDQGDSYVEVWCEICGEPHYTQDCYYYQGQPTYQYEEPYPYLQPFEDPSIPPSPPKPNPSLYEMLQQGIDLLSHPQPMIAYSKEVVENGEISVRESEEQLHRIEEQNIVINDLCAKYRQESSSCDTSLIMDREHHDESQVEPNISFSVLKQTSELETIMEGVQFPSSQITAQGPPLVHMDLIFMSPKSLTLTC